MNTNSECSTTAENGICFCPIEGVIEILSKKWALVIIGTISNHKRIRFNELMKSLTGISPRTLSMRLKELEKAELIKRENFARKFRRNSTKSRIYIDARWHRSERCYDSSHGVGS
jgi:DNA-binding HxlR family transcriptional regulator